MDTRTNILTAAYIIEHNLADLLLAPVSTLVLTPRPKHFLELLGLQQIYQAVELQREEILRDRKMQKHIGRKSFNELSDTLRDHGLGQGWRLTREAKVMLNIAFADDDPREALGPKVIADGLLKTFEETLQHLPRDYPNRDAIFVKLQELRSLLTH